MKIILQKKAKSGTIETNIKDSLSILEACKVLKEMREKGWKVKPSSLGELL